jgi:hypothetical protein
MPLSWRSDGLKINMGAFYGKILVLKTKYSRKIHGIFTDFINISNQIHTLMCYNKLNSVSKLLAFLLILIHSNLLKKGGRLAVSFLALTAVAHWYYD